MALIEITSKTTIADLNGYLKTIENSDPKEITLKLARNRKNMFFHDSTLVSFLATLVDRKNKLTIIDWHKEWKDKEIRTHFENSLVGVFALFFAEEVLNLVKEAIPPREIEEIIDSSGNILENHTILHNDRFLHPPAQRPRSGNYLTFVFLDRLDRDSKKLLKSSHLPFYGLIDDKDRFIKRMISFKSRYFDNITKKTKKSENSSKYADYERDLFSMVWELYSNAYHYGNYSTENKRELGCVFIKMQKHILQKEEVTLKHCGDSYVTNFANNIVLRQKIKSLVEISIYNKGNGVITKFLSSKKGKSFLKDLPLFSNSNKQLLEQIITTSLSEKEKESSGLGFMNSLKSLEELGGIFILKTEKLQLCFYPYKKNQYRIETIDSSYISGTLINILVPHHNSDQENL